MQQLGGFNKVAAMTGAANFIDLGNGVSFKFKGCRKINCLRVVLDADDTYTVDFYKVNMRTFDVKEVKTLSGMYCDQLIPTFESTTGLYLSL